MDKKLKWTRRAALGLAGGGLGAGVLASSCAPKPEPREQTPASGPFKLGVASGDPLQDKVILWTAVQDETKGGEIRFELSKEESFATIVQSGTLRVPAMPDSFSPVKVDVAELQAGTEYFYRFWRAKSVSAIGRTKTLPRGNVNQIDLAVVSCSNFPYGYFHAYAHIAREKPVDAVLALGDYIYEYAMGEYATDDAEALGRMPEPRHECVSYADYAKRYIQYHRDADLQAAHASAPWIMIWDDHELANDAFVGGAENHGPDEGDWAAREAASLRAFYDWTPTREPANGQPVHAFWRSFNFGNLARITMLETRLSGRSEQIYWDAFPVSNDADPADPVVLEKIKTFEEELIGNPKRRMLGDAQGAFVGAELASSVASGQPWQILGNQCLLAHIRLPNYIDTLPGWLKWLAKRKSPYVYEYFLRSRFHPLINLDAWDGYPAARERLYDKIKAAGANLLVVTGDTHDFNAHTLRDQQGNKIGVELGTSAVCSPGNFSDVVAPGVDFGAMTEAQNPDTLLHDAVHPGYIRLQVQKEQVLAEYIATSTVKQVNWKSWVAHRFKVTKEGIVKSGRQGTS